ncbi:MAG: amino acid ABC transporter permease [Methylobacteriaceae bacterium]|nr:amino acid ABC transporter permease [Methylobacteriaceae bacterium]
MSLFQPALFVKYLLSFDYFQAALTTLWISLAALVLGLAVGLVLAIARDTKLPLLRSAVFVYLWLFRGTPVLLQIVFAFNVLPSFGVVLPGFACAVLALGLNEGAYIAEIFRSGISAIGVGQRDAAKALGLTEWRTMRLVILPQALRVVIPPVGNQFISMLKLSALVSVIGVQELLLVADHAAASNFRYFEAFAAAGLYYIALTTLFMTVQHRIEKALGRRQGATHGAPAETGVGPS